MQTDKHDLPKGWTRTKIQYVCDLVGGGTPSRKVSEYFGGNTLWLTPTEIPKDRIVQIFDSREKITKLGLQKSSAKLVPSGSVLLTSRASIGFVAIAGAPVTTNQGFASFIPSDVVFNYFLAYWLCSNKDILVEKATGTTFKEIAKSVIRQLTIDLPPLAEQRRIVHKIESIFAQIDACKERLERLALQTSSGPGNLAQLKGSVLKQAFEGNLVPQDPNDEPAKTMLKKLHFDKKELEFENKETHEGWVKIKLSELITVTRGRSYRSAELKKSRNALVTLKSFKQNGGYRPEGLKPYIGPFKNEQIIKPGEVIIAQTDVAQKGYVIGRPAIVPSHPDYDYLIASLDVAIVRNKYDDCLDLKFLYYRLLTPDYIYHTKSYCKGIIVLHLSQNALPSFQLHLPPLPEQHHIVSKIESIFAKIDATDRLVRDSLIRLDLLKKSVLKQAFEGRLVTQDPRDEPAEMLLQRIKQEQKPRNSRNVK